MWPIIAVLDTQRTFPSLQKVLLDRLDTALKTFPVYVGFFGVRGTPKFFYGNPYLSVFSDHLIYYNTND